MKNLKAINNFIDYLSKEKRSGFTSTEGGALVPQELLKSEELKNVVDLTKLVRVVEVRTGTGKYPLIKRSGNKMINVKELETNPELAHPVIIEVPYEVETYRGYIPVSQEIIDDAKYTVAEIVVNEIKDQELNTKNEKIASILKTATPKAVQGIDGLKKLVNVDLKNILKTRATAVISSSLYDAIDKAKDETGRYLLQTDISAKSGESLLGYNLVVLDDDMIGDAEGDQVGFIGDPESFIVLFDRMKSTVKWIDNMTHGQLLQSSSRFQVKKYDDEAGIYFTYTS